MAAPQGAGREVRPGNGSEISERIVTDAMPLSPNDPSMLDERTAIMTALENRYHARADFNQLVDTVYSVFAQRGMGASAFNHVSEADPTGANDTDGVPVSTTATLRLTASSLARSSTLDRQAGRERPHHAGQVRSPRYSGCHDRHVRRRSGSWRPRRLPDHGAGQGIRQQDVPGHDRGRRQDARSTSSLSPNLASKTFGATAGPATPDRRWTTPRPARGRPPRAATV